MPQKLRLGRSPLWVLGPPRPVDKKDRKNQKEPKRPAQKESIAFGKRQGGLILRERRKREIPFRVMNEGMINIFQMVGSDLRLFLVGAPRRLSPKGLIEAEMDRNYQNHQQKGKGKENPQSFFTEPAPYRAKIEEEEGNKEGRNNFIARSQFNRQ